MEKGTHLCFLALEKIVWQVYAFLLREESKDAFERCSLRCDSLHCACVKLEGGVLSSTQKEGQCANQQSNLDVGVGGDAGDKQNS